MPSLVRAEKARGESISSPALAATELDGPSVDKRHTVERKEGSPSIDGTFSSNSHRFLTALALAFAGLGDLGRAGRAVGERPGRTR